MSQWANHLLGLAALEVNSGKRIAFETSAKKIDELEAENQALRNELAKYKKQVASDDKYLEKASFIELERDQLRNELEALKHKIPPTENGKNRYGLDMSYFRNLFNRELNRSLRDFRPDELARVLARASRTADESVMFEKEFIDINKIKADAICDLADNYVNGSITTELTVEYIYEYANKLEQDND